MVKKCSKGLRMKNGRCKKKSYSSRGKNKNNGMKIFLGISLALIFFGLFNLGIVTFYDSPDYSDFCTDNFSSPDKLDPSEIDFGQCNSNYEEARNDYSTKLFYIFVISGLILAVGGLFIISLPFQIVGLAGGTALIIEGILRNLQNKNSAFIAGVLVFSILSYFVWRKFR